MPFEGERMIYGGLEPTWNSIGPSKEVPNGASSSRPEWPSPGDHHAALPQRRRVAVSHGEIDVSIE